MWDAAIKMSSRIDSTNVLVTNLKPKYYGHVGSAQYSGFKLATRFVLSVPEFFFQPHSTSVALLPTYSCMKVFNGSGNLYILKLYIVNTTALLLFLENNIKRYDVGEHEKSVEGKRGKAETSVPSF